MRIAVFDSGVGGITVLKELRTHFPSYDFFYYGDTANVPYGIKSHSQIKNLVQQASREIKNQNVDALVIACNTAACIALEECREIMEPIPVYSVVEAGISTITRILDQTKEPLPVLVLGTRVTIKSQTYSNTIKQDAHREVFIYEQACPMFVPLIEEGWKDHPVMKTVAEEYLKPYFKLKPGIVFLACTHYPWIKSVIETVMPNWKVMDSAHTMAEMLDKQMKNDRKTSGHVTWHFTDPETASSFAFTEGQLDSDK